MEPIKKDYDISLYELTAFQRVNIADDIVSNLNWTRLGLSFNFDPALTIDYLRARHGTNLPNQQLAEYLIETLSQRGITVIQLFGAMKELNMEPIIEKWHLKIFKKEASADLLNDKAPILNPTLTFAGAIDVDEIVDNESPPDEHAVAECQQLLDQLTSASDQEVQDILTKVIGLLEKDVKSNLPVVYKYLIANEKFIESFCQLAEGEVNITDEREIGKGASGAVFNVDWKDGDIKYVAKQFDDAALKSFIKEMLAMQFLHHKNLMPSLGITKIDGQWAIIMRKLLRNLDGVIRFQEKLKLTLKSKVEILLKVAEGIKFLHDRNIAHLDIKPENVLVSDDLQDVFVTDFGISYFFTDSTTLFKTIASQTTVKGTIMYVAPELYDQLVRKNDNRETQPVKVTRRADLYSFGGLMTYVFKKEIGGQIHTKREEDFVLDSTKVVADFPNVLSSLIHSCMRKTPEARPRFDQVITDLKRLL